MHNVRFSEPHRTVEERWRTDARAINEIDTASIDIEIDDQIRTSVRQTEREKNVIQWANVRMSDC